MREMEATNMNQVHQWNIESNAMSINYNISYIVDYVLDYNFLMTLLKNILRQALLNVNCLNSCTYNVFVKKNYDI